MLKEKNQRLRKNLANFEVNSTKTTENEFEKLYKNHKN